MKAGLQVLDTMRQHVEILQQQAGQLDGLFGVALLGLPSREPWARDA